MRKSLLVIIPNSRHVVGDNSNRGGELNVEVEDNDPVFIGISYATIGRTRKSNGPDILLSQIVEISACQKFWN